VIFLGLGALFTAKNHQMGAISAKNCIKLGPLIVKTITVLSTKFLWQKFYLVVRDFGRFFDTIGRFLLRTSGPTEDKLISIQDLNKQQLKNV
jgi:hypothetical protein